jgi:hypothetical protein
MMSGYDDVSTLYIVRDFAIDECGGDHNLCTEGHGCTVRMITLHN